MSILSTRSCSAPTSVDVDTASKVVVAESYFRIGLILTNLSTGTMYLAFGNTSTLQAGIPLLANGGVFSMDNYTFSKEAVTAIAHSDNSLLAIQEFVNLA